MVMCQWLMCYLSINGHYKMEFKNYGKQIIEKIMENDSIFFKTIINHK